MTSFSMFAQEEVSGSYAVRVFWGPVLVLGYSMVLYWMLELDIGILEIGYWYWHYNTGLANIDTAFASSAVPHVVSESVEYDTHTTILPTTQDCISTCRVGNKTSNKQNLELLIYASFICFFFSSLNSYQQTTTGLFVQQKR